MSKTKEPTTIKKYANRRLYNTGTSTYVTLDDLAEMVKREDDFVVYDAKTGEDITRSVLTQIIFEQESRGPNLLPITFLRQLIRFYGDSLHRLVPTYLDASIASLVREQQRFREQMAQAFGAGAFGAVEEHVRRNAEMFERAMRMFFPFGPGPAGHAGQSANAASKAAPPEERAPEAPSPEIEDLRRQMEEMQKKLDALASRNGA